MHSHGKVEHDHAGSEDEHAHLQRAICVRWECKAFPTHDVHPIDQPSFTCWNCEQPFEPVSRRWLCPSCGAKSDCCSGEPLPQR